MDESFETLRPTKKMLVVYCVLRIYLFCKIGYANMAEEDI